jgi:hypothetical protein
MTDEATTVEVKTIATPDAGKGVIVKDIKSGRRRSDWHVIESNGKSIFFWLFGMFLDEKGKPSMSRIMFAVWTWVGIQMEYHEIRLMTGGIPISNAAWTAWWSAEGVIALAVLGPPVASYFSPGAAGAAAATAIPGAVRDVLEKMGIHPPAPAVPVTPTDVNSGAEGG